MAGQASKNSDDAFGRMLVALQPRLRAFLKNLSRGDADDLVQESITRAWRSRATFDADRGDPEAWLMRIAFRAFLDPNATEGLALTNGVEAWIL